jgi:hypothetical protein
MNERDYSLACKKIMISFKTDHMRITGIIIRNLHKQKNIYMYIYVYIYI